MFQGPIRARLQETNSLRRPRWKYPGKTASSSCWCHLNHSAQHTQSFPGRARRSLGEFRGRVQDVVCQLVGFGLVPRYVMEADGFEGTLQNGVQHIHCIISIMWFISLISIWMNIYSIIDIYDIIILIGIIDIKRDNAYNILKIKQVV